MSKGSKIVCAAIRNKRTGLIICSPRHFDYVTACVIEAMNQSGDWADADQGFVDNYGKFFDRIEAKEIAVASGQVSENEVQRLFSEDLY